jgi:signal transduction histidine kinase
MRRRLLFSYLSLTLFVLLALELPLGVSFANAEHRRLVSQVETEAFAIALRAAAPLSAQTEQSDEELARLVNGLYRRSGHGLVVVGQDGAVIASAGGGEPNEGEDASTERSVAAALSGRRLTHERDSGGEHKLLSATVPVLDGREAVGAVRVSASLEVVARRVRDNWVLLAILGGVVAAVVLLVSVLLARSFSRPLRALDEGAVRLGQGDLQARVPVPKDPPELRGLAESFNATAERLETLVRSQQSFVADASHQLRTPLAALSLRLENLEAEEEFHVEDLEGALAEARRLSQLVDGLLAMARAEDAPAASADIELEPLVDGRVLAWHAVAAERGVDIITNVDPVAVRSVPGRLEQVLDNLISNALDVAPSGTAVRVESRLEHDRVILEVRDAGPGMTPEQRARAFDRFWRAEPARKDIGGFGLGLAVVRRLVMADRGTVELRAAPEGGLAVMLRLRLGLQPGGAATRRKEVGALSR